MTSVGSRLPGARVHVRHRTEFTFEPAAAGSFNEARMTPRSDDRQVVLTSSVAVDPVTWTHHYLDYWGSAVTAIESLTRHRRFVVTAEALVDTYPQQDPPDGTWADLRTSTVRDQFVEYLTQTPLTDPATDLADAAAAAVDQADSPTDAATAICGLVSEAMEYEGGSTEVTTTANAAWAQRRGVCQDFAHVCLGALRSVGIPARYVSGYLHPDRSAEVGVTVAGESHAWVEFWTGAWYGWDPTNQHAVDVLHVSIGRGRDYKDVSPLRGIVSSTGGSRLTVEVEVTRQA